MNKRDTKSTLHRRNGKHEWKHGTEIEGEGCKTKHTRETQVVNGKEKTRKRKTESMRATHGVNGKKLRRQTKCTVGKVSWTTERETSVVNVTLPTVSFETQPFDLRI